MNPSATKASRGGAVSPRVSNTTPRTRAPRAPQMASQRHQFGETQSDQVTPVKQQRKRKTPTRPTLGSEVVDLTADTPASATKKPRTQNRHKGDGCPEFERRTRRWRDHPPQSYLARLERIAVQRFEYSRSPWFSSANAVCRMFVIGHTVGGTEEIPEISFDIAGSTGNLYKTVIGKEPACDCPDGAKGNQCKHICYGKTWKGQNLPSSNLISLNIQHIILTDGVSSPCPCSQSAHPSPVPTGVFVLGKWLLCIYLRPHLSRQDTDLLFTS